MRWLDERGIGLEVGPARVPLVPSAVLFDLPLGDPAIRPDAAAGYAACEAASTQPPAEGTSAPVRAPWWARSSASTMR
jgi:L-aminopeptidase/D-esterase-like protein